jgi:5-methylthioadenosine/S-adenosylhomocysteine deaminase
MTRIAIEGAFVATLNEKNTIHHDGLVLLENDKIEYVGPRVPYDRGTCARVIDGENCLVIPGLVNAHWHSMTNIFRGLFNCMPLELWRQYVKTAYKLESGRLIYLDAMIGHMEMLKSGVTTAVDHFTDFYPQNHEGLGYAWQAFEDSGLRGILSLMLTDINYEDTVPLDVSTLSAETQSRISNITRNETSSGIANAEHFLRSFTGKSARVYPQLGPGAPQRCSRELLTRVRELADEFDIGMHMHVLETRTQQHLFTTKYRHTAIEHLHEAGFLCDRLAMAHVIWATENDLELIAKAGASVVHNPVSNLKLGSGIAPVIKMQEHGINVSLGTDGPASNDNQDMLFTVKLAALLQNITEWDYRKWPTALSVLRMATRGGARALYLHKEIGILEAGKKADLVVIRTDTLPFTPINDPISQLVFCEKGQSVQHVIIDGRMVLQDGQITTVDECRLLNEARLLRKELEERLHKALAETKELEPALAAMYFKSTEAAR